MQHGGVPELAHKIHQSHELELFVVVADEQAAAFMPANHISVTAGPYRDVVTPQNVLGGCQNTNAIGMIPYFADEGRAPVHDHCRMPK
jgi:hypothetical protein